MSDKYFYENHQRQEDGSVVIDDIHYLSCKTFKLRKPFRSRSFWKHNLHFYGIIVNYPKPAVYYSRLFVERKWWSTHKRRRWINLKGELV